MDLDLNGKIRIAMYGDVRYAKGHWHKGRRLDVHLVLFLRDGNLTMQIEDGTYHAEAGDILFIEAGAFYRPLDSCGCHYTFFHFEAEESEKATQPKSAAFALAPDCRGFAYYFDKTPETIELISHFKPKKQLEIKAKLSLARPPLEAPLLFRELMHLLKSETESESKSNRTLGEITRYIEQKIASPLTLSDLSEKFFLSRSYIARLFRDQFGISAGEYILDRKLLLARTWLSESDCTIGEIAERLGFSSPFYFSRVFAMKLGISPRKYRKQKL